jgi:hypothetical protein
MIEAPLSAPPKAYMDIIGPLINKAKEFLESGETLQAIAFVGNLTSRQVIPVLIQQASGEDKDSSAKTIQKMASISEADFVFTIMEAWSLRPDKVPQMDAIMDKYGSIGASPYAIDVCSMLLETKRGIWVAQPTIKAKGVSKKKRTFGPVEFRYYTEVEGRFSHLLPAKEGDEPPAMMH